MSTILASKKTELKTLVAQAQTKRAELEAKHAKGEQFDSTELNTMIDRGTALRAEVKRLEDLDQLGAIVDSQEADQQGALDAARRAAGSAKHRTWGGAFVASEAYKGRDAKGHTQPVNVKALEQVGSVDAQGGYLVVPQRLSEVYDRAPQRARTLLDVLNVSPTTSDSIEYVILNSFTNNAAPKKEYNAGAFVAAAKSGMDFAMDSTTVKTITHYVAASKRILADAPRIQNLVDVKLTDGVEIKLEDQILLGDGTGENFLGILNTPNIQKRIMDGVGGEVMTGRNQKVDDTFADTLRRAITDIRLAFYKANALVLNPSDAEDLELQKDGNKNYMMIYDPVAQRIWRVPVVETVAMPAKRSLVGDFEQGATLFDRQDTQISVGQPNGFFLEGAVAILAELRAALATTDPKAFEDILVK
jgi:HK97 family phage major capsid protein